MSSDAFTISVDIEFDCGGGNNTSETGTETSEECSPSFSAIDIADYSCGFMTCVLGINDRWVRRRCGGGCRGFLVEIGLETSSENI